MRWTVCELTLPLDSHLPLARDGLENEFWYVENQATSRRCLTIRGRATLETTKLLSLPLSTLPLAQISLLTRSRYPGQGQGLGQAPAPALDSLSDRLTNSFAPIDFDIWDATQALKPSASTPTFSRFSPDGRDPRDPHSQRTSPATFAARSLSSDPQSQPSNLSPRLLTGKGGLTESKAHNRQTSIVHGIQHSRNGSSTSASSSPLSPQMIIAAGTDASTMGDSTFANSLVGLAGSASFSSSTSTVVPDRASSATENGSYHTTQKRVERMHSGKSSRDHRHHHSHSRHHHKEELKTVGEYALHVLFTSVSSITIYPSQTC